MKLTGNLADLGLAEILNVVGATRRSGMLRLHLDGLEAVIAFRSGAIVGLSAPGIPATPEELAARAGATSARDPALAEWHSARVEAALGALLGEAHGSFEFQLVERVADAAAAAGIVLLEEGLPAAKLLSPPPRGTETRSSAVPSRAGRLLIPEDALALPGEAKVEVAAAPIIARGEAPPPTEVAASDGEDTVVLPMDEKPAAHRLLVLALPPGDLRRQLVRRAGEAGWRVREPASFEEAELALESSTRNGHTVALIAQATGATIPGLDLLACLKSMDRSAACALLLEAGAGSARLAPLRARASSLGAGILALLPPLSGGGEADALAADLLERVLAAPSAPRVPPPPVGLTAAASGPDPAWAADDAMLSHVVDLDSSAALLAAARHASEASLLVLAAAAEYFERGVLLLREELGLLPIGAIIPHGDRPPESLLQGKHLQPGQDVLSRVAAQGARFMGAAPAEQASRDALRFVGAERPGRIAAVPLVAASGCFAVLYCDDAGDPEAQPDLTRFLSFIEATGPSLHAAFTATDARAAARRARLQR